MSKRYSSRNAFIVFSITAGVFLLIIGTFYQAVIGTVQAKTASLEKSAATKATANLQHAPTGAANLSYNTGAKTLTVRIALISLAPNSTHPAHIHSGNCASAKTTDPIQHPLQNVVSNGVGQGSSTTILHNITNIPASGWYINVHNGPGLKPADQFAPIACGNISRTGTATQFRVPLGATDSPNEHANGTSHLQVNHDKLTVALSVRGLVPNSLHAAHVHAGSCASTGNVIYNLSPLQANAQGNVSKTITFNNVSSIPANGWTINVHDTNNLSTQTGYNPILCGNVIP